LSFCLRFLFHVAGARRHRPSFPTRRSSDLVKRGETEYGIKAIPLGGFVKLVGMLPPKPGDEPTKVRRTNTGLFTQLIDDARTARSEEHTSELQSRFDLVCRLLLEKKKNRCV